MRHGPGHRRPLLTGVGPRYGRAVQVDLLFDPFGGRWEDLRDAAVLAEESGFDGVWLSKTIDSTSWQVLSAVGNE